MGIEPPWMTSDDPTVKNTKRAAEIVHRRLATIVTMGMFFQDGSTDSAGCDWVSLHGVPAAHLEYEPGVQAPVNFWDLVDFIMNGSVKNFNRRRAGEVKHGRVCMMAVMGYITTEIRGKFPGL